MPFTNCDEFMILSSDCSSPKSVICPCCTRCFGLFTVNEDVLPCPSSVLTVKPQGTTRLDYYVENDNSQLVYEHTSYRAKGLVESCISPTDCMTITSAWEGSFAVAVDGNVVFENIQNYGIKYPFGYSKTGIMQPDTCDEYVICNRALLPNTAQRSLFNLITRFSGVVSLFLGVCAIANFEI